MTVAEVSGDRRVEAMGNTAETPIHEDLFRGTEGLRKLVRNLMRDASEVDDVLQEVRLEVLEGGGTPPRNHAAWLSTVARRVASTFARGEGRRRRRGSPKELPSRA